MMKQMEERFENMEQEIANMKMGLQQLPELETKMTKHMEKIDVQNELNTQQQKILKYIENIMKNSSSSTPELEKASSKMEAKMFESNEEPNSNEKEEGDKSSD